MSEQKTFRLTDDHIVLLSYACVRFDDSCEWGAPGLDCKRPFGNSDLVDDMADILDVASVETDDGPCWPPGTHDRMLKIYREELPTALQVVLSTNSFTPGTYAADEYRDNWRLVSEGSI